MYQSIINFWFEEIEQVMWWKKDDEFDELIRDRFLDLHQAANKCELSEWRAQPEGRLAEIIVLDQFSRNMYRNSPLAFASDPLALALSQEAVRCGADKLLNQQQRSFLYMPFMHSESKIVHKEALKIFKALDNQSNYEFELKHKIIIDRFGRYPHRNATLGRDSSADEMKFLKLSGSSF